MTDRTTAYEEVRRQGMPSRRPEKKSDGSSGSADGSGPNWELILQFLGLGAALAAWVAVVGGARVWARLADLDLPTVPTLVGVGREWMIVEGLQTLLVPILLGSFAAVAVYFLMKNRDAMHEYAASEIVGVAVAGAAVVFAVTTLLAISEPDWSVVACIAVSAFLLALCLSQRKRVRLLIIAAVVIIGTLAVWWVIEPMWSVALLAILIALGFVIGILLAVVQEVNVGEILALSGGLFVAGLLLAMYLAVSWWFVIMIVVTVVAALFMLALGRDVVQRAGGDPSKEARSVAFAVFAVIVVWSGFLGYVQVRGDTEQDLDEALIALNDGSQVTGTLLGRSADRVFLAQPIGEDPTQVLVIDNEDVACLAYARDRLDPASVSGINSCEIGVKESIDPGPSLVSGGLWSLLFDDLLIRLPSTFVLPPPDRPETGGRSAPIAFKDGTINGQDSQFQIVGLTRRNDYIVLNGRVFNLSPHPLVIESALSRTGDDSVSGIEAFAADRRRVYLVATQGRGDNAECACDRNLDEVDIAPGAGYFVSATFELPQNPGKVNQVDVRVPGFGYFDNVAIG